MEMIFFIFFLKTLTEGSGVVGTLMTNKALEIHFEENNIDFYRADVGDKYVLQKLVERNWLLRGRAIRPYYMFRLCSNR